VSTIIGRRRESQAREDLLRPSSNGGDPGTPIPPEPKEAKAPA
jgi:hypothetical protein